MHACAPLLGVLLSDGSSFGLRFLFFFFLIFIVIQLHLYAFSPHWLAFLLSWASGGHRNYQSMRFGFLRGHFPSFPKGSSVNTDHSLE